MLNAGSLIYQATGDEALRLQVAEEWLQVARASDPAVILAEKPLQEITSGAQIASGSFDVQLTIDASVTAVTGGIDFVGGEGFNTLVGPAVDTEWFVTRDGVGHVVNEDFVRFSQIENLRGAAANKDTFHIGQHGTVRGEIDGGGGGFDTMVVKGIYERIVYGVLGPRAGTITLDGSALTYQGMEPIVFTEAATDFVFETLGSAAGVGLVSQADNVTLRDIGGADGQMEIFGTSDGVAFATVQFHNPTGSLQIFSYGGSDQITIASIDPEFSADLLVYGNRDGAPLRNRDDVDRITFAGDISTNGGYLEAFADDIIVGDSVTLSTIDQRLTTFDPATAIAADSLTIDLGTASARYDEGDEVVYVSGGGTAIGGLVSGESYTIVEADGSRVALANELGTLLTLDASAATGTQHTLARVENDIVFRVRQIANADLENMTPLFVVDQKSVSIDIGANALLEGAGIYLIASAEDRTLSEQLGTNNLINNFLIDTLESHVAGLAALPVHVIGKASSANITVRPGARILGSGPVGLYSTASADASGQASGPVFSAGYAHAVAEAVIDIQTGVQIESGEAMVITSDASATATMSTETTRDSSGLAGPVGLSLAVTYAHVTSTATVADGASLTAGKTANVRSLATLESEAESQSAREATGGSAQSFAIELSDADVHSTVNGDITARMEAPYAVKLEIDPTVTDPSQTGYVDYENNMINVGGTGLVTEDTIEYSNRRGNSIGRFGGNGLVDGETYVVISVEDDPTTPGLDESNFIQLARTEQQAIDGIPIDLVFDPNVPTANNTKSFSGDDVDGQANTISLDNQLGSGSGVDFSLFGNTFELGQAVFYRQGSVPIPGLIDGGMYYVITDLDQFGLQGDNRFVDRQVIQLAELENEARAGVAIDIGEVQDGATDFSLEAAHILDSGFATGVGIISSLDASDSASATAGLEQDSSTSPVPDGFTQSIATSIYQAFAKLFTNNASKAGAGANRSLQTGGALAVSVGTHSVVTDVGSNSNIRSNEDLEVVATVDEKVQLAAESSTEPMRTTTETQTGETQENAAPNTVSTALNVGVMTNTAKATVHEGASLDALRNNRVISRIQYPHLTRPDEFIPSTFSEFLSSVESEGFDSVTQYLDGTLGLQDGLFNSRASSSAESKNVAVAGSINVMIFVDRAESIVEDHVRINQDLAWRDPSQNPHPNHSALPDGDGLGEQVVSVESSNFKQLINMAGIFSFDLPSIDLGGASIDKTFELSPVASEAGAGGVGGAIFLQLMDHTTHSIVGDGAQIYSGLDGGFNIKADELIFDLNFGQAGAESDEFAVGGTVLFTQQTSDTLAQLSNTATVTGRNLDMYAASFGLRATWAGGVSASETVGVGIGLGANRIDRKTRAVVGPVGVPVPPPALPPTTTAIDVSGDVDIRAVVGGQIWSFAVAGTSIPGRSPKKPAGDETGPGGTEAATTVPGASLPSQFDQEAASEMSSQSTGVGLAGAVSVNVVNDQTQASIINAGTIRAGGDVRVAANNDLFHVAATGAAAFSSGFSLQSSNALAGAFSFNNLDISTRALLHSVNVIANNVKVDAKRTGDLITVSAGAAESTNSQGSTVAGSVSLNRVINTTESLVVGAVVSTSGSVDLSAIDRSAITAIGGGGSSGARGYGFSVGTNQIDTDTTAAIRNASVSSRGAIDVDASNDNVMRSVGISIGAGKQTGIAFTLGINLIDNDVTAELVSTSVTTATTVDVNASDDSNMQAFGGVAGVGFSSAGFGGSLGWNSITGGVTARIADSTLMNIVGDVRVRADYHESDLLLDGKILSAAVGAAGASGTAIGAGVSVNLIRSTIAAEIAGSSLTTAGAVEVTAADQSTIKSLTGGIALSTSSGGVGGAVSNNDILNTVRAHVTDSSLDAAGLIVAADQQATIESISVGLAGAQSFSFGGSVSVNVIENVVEAKVDGDTTSIFVDDNVLVAAIDDATIKAVAGGIGIAKDIAVGAAIATNTISTVIGEGQSVRASISNATIDAGNNVDIRADSQQQIQSLSVAGSGAQTFALGGSVSALTTNVTTDAGALGSAQIDAGNNVVVAANSDAQLDSLAGSLAVAVLAPTASFAFSAANSTIITDDDTRARIGAGAVVNALANGNASTVPTGRMDERVEDAAFHGVSVTATSSEAVRSLAAGAAFAAGGSIETAFASFALAGSATATTLDETTLAEIQPGATINGAAGAGADQEVNVFADDSTTLIGAAGGLGGAVWAGGGAGVDVSTVLKTTDARVGGTISAVGDVMVQALSDEDVLSVTAAGGVGAVAVSGAANTLLLGTEAKPLTTRAGILSGAVVTAGDSVLVAADDDSESDILAGSIQAGLAAIGGAVGVATVSKIVDASVGQDANVTALGLGDGVTAATGEIRVTYDSTPPVTDPLNNEIEVPSITTDLNDPSLGAQRVASLVGATRFGIAVTATHRDDAESYVLTAGLSAPTSLAGFTLNLSGSVNVANVDVGAVVNAASLVTENGGDVGVIAISDHYQLGIGGAGSVTGGGAAASPGVATSILSATTAAQIINGSTVTADGGIDVSATQQEDILLMTASAAGGGDLNAAGAASFIDLTGAATARIGATASIAAAGDVAVHATDHTDADLLAGGLSLGSLGFGGSVGVVMLTKETTADSLGTLALTGPAGQLEVLANSSENIFNVAASGAVGAGTLAGAASVEIVDSDTTATVGGSVSGAESVQIDALNDLDIRVVDGTVSGSLFGAVAGGVDIGIIRNDTTARVADDALIDARFGVSVLADASKDIDSAIASAAAAVSANLAAAAAVAVYSIGGIVDATYSVGGNSAEPLRPGGQSSVGYIDTAITNPNSAAILGAHDSDSNDPYDPAALPENAPNNNTQGKAGLATAQTRLASSQRTSPVESAIQSIEQSNGTTAYIGSGATVAGGAGDVTVVAADALYLNIIAGGASGGFALGAGAGIAIVSIGSQTTSYVDTAANVSTAAQIAVEATASQATEVLSLAGAGGGAALGASVAVIDNNSQTIAEVKGAALTGAAEVRVAATNDADVKTSALAAAVGGIVAGAAVVDVDVNAATRAQIVGTATVGSETAPVGNLQVITSSTTDVGGVPDFPATAVNESVMVAGIGGGVLSGIGGSASTTVTPTAAAGILGAPKINVDGNVAIQANSIHHTSASANGVALGIASVGIMLADATVNGTTTATVGSASITAANVNIHATSNNQATAVAVPVTGGLISGAGAGADAVVDHDTRSSTGGIIDSGGGVIRVDADSTGTARSTAGVAVFGVFGIGYSDADAVVRGDTVAEVLPAADLVASDINVLATGNHLSEATVFSARGGVATGDSTNATANTAPWISARVGVGAQINAADDIRIDADSTGRSLAMANGVSASGINVSTTRSTANTTPTVEATIGGLASLAATDRIDIEATFNRTPTGLGIANSARARSTSSNGTLLSSIDLGTEAVVVASPTVSTVIGTGADVLSDGTIAIRSDAYNQPRVDADGDNTGLVTQGGTNAQITLGGSVSTTVGQDTHVGAPNRITIAAVAESKPAARAEGGTGSSDFNLGSLFSGNVGSFFGSLSLPSLYARGGTRAAVAGDTTATTTIADRATVGFILHPGTIDERDLIPDQLDLIARATAVVDADAIQRSSGAAAFAVAVSDVRVDVDGTIVLGADTVIHGGAVDLLAENRVGIDSFADAFTAAGGAFSTAVSRAILGSPNDISLATVNIRPRSQIVGDQSINIEATGSRSAGDINARSSAVADAEGLATANAAVDASIFADSRITADADSEMTTSDLLVNALTQYDAVRLPTAVAEGFITEIIRVVEEVTETVTKNIPFVGKVVREVTREVVRYIERIVPSDVEVVESGIDDARTDSVVLNGTISLGTAQDRSLTVAADGSITGNIGATLTPDAVVVDDVVNDAGGSAELRAPRGFVTGSAFIILPSILQSVAITNDSDRELVINRIDPISDNSGRPDTTVIDLDGRQGDNFTFSNGSDFTTITIDNDGVVGGAASDVIFAQSILDAIATLSVTNARGDIRAANENVAIEFGNGDPAGPAVALTASGDIGTSALPLPVRLVRLPGRSNAELEISAHDVWLDVTALQIAPSANLPVNLAGYDLQMTAGGDINTILHDGYAAAAFELDGAKSVTAGPGSGLQTQYALDGVTAGGDIQIVSAAAANQPVGLAVTDVRAASGSILLNLSGDLIDGGDAAEDLSAPDATLLASGSIGSAGNALDTNFDRLEADAGGTIVLSNSSSLTLGTAGGFDGVQSGRDVDIAVAGELIVSEDITAGGDLRLRTIDELTGNQNLSVRPTSTLTAGGTVALTAGDDLLVESGARIVTPGSIDLVADGQSRDAAGGILSLFGAVDAMMLNLATSNDDDHIIINADSIRGDLFVATAGGNDRFDVTLFDALAVQLDGEAGVDDYRIQLAGASGALVHVDDSDTSVPHRVLIQGTSNNDQLIVTTWSIFSAGERVDLNPGEYLLEIAGGASDDSVILRDSLVRPTAVTGNAGDDTVQIDVRTIDPSIAGSADFTQLQLDVESLIVDNSQSPVGVDWTVRSGQIDAGANVVVSSEGAERSRILGGTGENSLRIISEVRSNVTGAIDGNEVELLEGEEVLAFQSVNNNLAAGQFDGLGGAAHIATTSDGRYVFVTATDDGAVTVFQSSPPAADASDWANAIASDSPLNWYRLNDSGSIATDEQGNLHGSYIGVDAENGVLDGGRRFRENGDRIELGGTPISTAWTAEFVLFNSGRNPGDASDHLLEDGATALKLDQFDGTGQLGFTEFSQGDHLFSPAVSTPLNRYAHVTFVGDPAFGTKVYVDGELKGSNSTFIALPRGRVGDLATESLNALIDEVVLYDSALSPERIAAHSAALSATLQSTAGPVDQPPLEYLQTIRIDADGGTGNPGLTAPRSLVVSPGNRHVYVAGDDVIQVFALEESGRWVSAGFTTSGLAFAGHLQLAISPDGGDVYATAPDSASLLVFDRLADGGLTLIQTLTGPSGLDLASSVEVTDDGSGVVVGFDGGIHRFSRDASGQLTLSSTQLDDKGLQINTQDLIWISPDGAFAYAVGNDSVENAIRVHRRDANTGDFLETIQSIPYDSAREIESNATGEVLYVRRTNGVDVYSRDSVTGVIAHLQTLSPGTTSALAIDGNVAWVLQSGASSAQIVLYGLNADGTFAASGTVRPVTTGSSDIIASPNTDNYYVRTLFGFQLFSRTGIELANISGYSSPVLTVSNLLGFDAIFVADDDQRTFYVSGGFGGDTVQFQEGGNHTFRPRFAIASGDQVYMTNEADQVEIIKLGEGRLPGLASNSTIFQTGIDGATGRLAISNDRQSLYGTSAADDAVFNYRNFFATSFSSTEIVDRTARPLENLLDVAVAGEFIYAVTSAGTLQVLNSSHAYVQTLTQPALEGARAIDASPDGRFINIMTSSDEILTYARNSTSGIIDATPVDLTDGPGGTSDLISVSNGAVGNRLFVTGATAGQLDVYDQDAMSGHIELSPVQQFIAGTSRAAAGLTSLVPTSAGFVYGISPMDDAVVVLKRDTAGPVVQMQQVAFLDVLVAPTAIALSPDEAFLYVTGRLDGRVTTLAIDGTDGSLSIISSLPNIPGLANPRSIVVSPDGAHVYVGGQSGLVTLDRAVDGTLQPSTLVAIAASDIVDVAIGADGSRLYAVSRSGNRLQVYDRDSQTGELTLGVEIIDGQPSFANLAGATAVAIDDRIASETTAYVASAEDDAVSVIRIDALGSATLVQAVRDGVSGVRGIAGASDLTIVDGFLFVSAAESDAVAVFRIDPLTGMLTYTQVVRNNVGGVTGMNAPTSIAADSAGNLYVGSLIGTGSSTGGIAVLSAETQNPTGTTITTTFSGIDHLSVETSSGDDSIQIRNAAPVLTTRIDVGEGNDRVTLNDLYASTSVALGAGDDIAALRSTAEATELTVTGSDGEDEFQVLQVGEDSTTTLSGGLGSDRFVVSGANLPASSSVTIAGDNPTTVPGDQLAFDPGAEGGVQRAVQTFLPDGSTPTIGLAIPAGQVQADGSFGRVLYNTLEAAQAITPPSAIIVAPPSINEGEGVSLQAAVETFGAAVDSVSWDIDGDGLFDDATGIAPVLTAAELHALGLNDGPGDYRIAVRVGTVNGTGAGSAILTVNNIGPTVTAGGDSAVGLGAPYALQFSAMDPGVDRVTAWTVDWGDGTVATLGSQATQAAHVYTAPMVTNVVVSATDEDGTYSAAPIPLTVTNAAPVINDVVLSDPVREGTPFSVTVYADDDGGTAGLTYAFDFSQPADGVFEVADSAPTTVHTFAESGTFSITIEVRDAFGEVSTQTVDVTVANVAPRIQSSSISGPLTEGSIVSFLIAATDPAGLADPLEYAFDFNNDGVYDAVSSDGTASFTFTDDGTYPVGIQVRDDDGGVTADTILIEITNVVPTVAISGGATSTEGQTYTLHLGPATDPGDDTIFQWQIYWGDGTVETVMADPATIDHVYADDGLFTITAIATDEDGPVAADTSVQVAVSNVAPVATISGATSANEGLYMLQLAVTDVGDDRVDQWVVDWGDGSPLESFAGDTVLATHFYDGGNPSSVYTISAWVADEDGTFAANDLNVSIANANPAVLSNQVLTPTPTEGQPVTIAVAATDLASDPLLYKFDFDDDGIYEQSSTTGQATHVFADNGTYTVAVRVEDGDGGEALTSVSVSVANAAPSAAVVGSATSLDEGSAFQLTVSFNDPGDDTVVEYTVDWGNGTVETISAANLNPTHIFDGPANVRPAVIRITDEDATFATLVAAAAVQINAIDPTLAVTPSSTSFVIYEPLALNLGDVLDPGADAVFQYTVQWGDGVVDTYVGSPMAGQVLTHQFIAAGSFTLRVTLSDEDGSYDVATVPLTVIPNTAPVADAGGSYTVAEGASLPLTAAGTTDTEQDPGSLIYEWDLDGDGLFGETGPDASFGDEVGITPIFDAATFDGPSSAIVALRVTDHGGLTHTTFATIEIANQPPTIAAQSFSIIENSPPGTVVGTITATDPGSDTLWFAITGGNGQTAFAIDPVTGQITVADAAQLDFETTLLFTLEVTITDDDGGIATGPVEIALINQASISGVVYVDADSDGEFDANELGIDDVLIELLDEDDGLLASTTTSGGGLYYFEDLPAGTYRIREIQPSGVDDGIEQLGTLGGEILDNDLMELIIADIDALDYNFAEIGQQLTSGDTAGMGFWQNKHGRQLIQQGGTALADWLTNQFGNIFGDALVGANGGDIAEFYSDQLFKQKGQKVAGPAKVDAQYMALALATFFTNSNLAGDVALSFGFNLYETGIGNKIVNIGAAGAAFNAADHAELTIMQLLLATNALTDEQDRVAGFAYIYDRNGDGLIDTEEKQLREQANDLFGRINELG